MIYPYVGDFLISPVPMQLSFNYCSHKCSYCCHVDQPVMLSNLRVKRSGDVKVGDVLLGFRRGEAVTHQPTGNNKVTESSYRIWDETIVTKVFHRKAPGVKVMLANGESVICTPDHHWYTGRSGTLEYKPASTRKGRKLYRINMPLLPESIFTNDYMTGYIRGVCEGDGNWQPSKSWRIALKDVEILDRIKLFLNEMGYGEFALKEYGSNMAQLQIEKANPANDMINGFDIDTLEYWRGWLAGIYDAEGNTSMKLDRKQVSVLRICQYKSENPLTYQRIERALRYLGFGYVSEPKCIRLWGGRLEAAKFCQEIQPVVKRKSNPLLGSTFKGLVNSYQIVSIEPIGEIDVASFETTTHNYISGGYLSRNCFANLNNPGRTFPLADFQAQIKAVKSRNDLQSVLLREKYPVLISNLVDPFATSNYQLSVPVIQQLTDMGTPVAIQTRGGRGVDDVLSFLPQSVWYVSIPMLNDDIRKKIEPAAPSIESRFKLISDLRSRGHKVIVGINPTVSEWLPGNDGETMIYQLKALCVTGIWVAAFHLNTKQVKQMSDFEKRCLGEDVMQKGLKNARDLQQGCFDFIDEMKTIALQAGLEVEGMFDGAASNFFKPFQDTYAKLFPTIHDFINWCHEHKKDGEPVYFQEFLKVMKGLPAGEHNLSPYMMCMSQQLVKEVHYKMSYKKLLWLCWNDHRMKRTLDRYWSFKIGVQENKTKTGIDWYRDDKGNKIYFFQRNGWEDEDEFLIVQ